MTVTAPPRPPRPSDPVDREEVEALVEALIEEARQRARRRRRVRMAVVACVVLVGATVFAVFERTAESQSSSPCAHGTVGRLRRQGKGRHRWHQRPHSARQRMEASRARAPSRPVGRSRMQGQRSPTGPSDADGTLITLRFVAKGKKGTITYVVKIDTNAGTSRWTIASGTKAYKGLHGKGTETENASYTVSTLRGTVSR